MSLRDILLSIIALLLFLLLVVNLVNRPATLQDLHDIESIEDYEERRLATIKFVNRLQIVHINGGSVTALTSDEIEEKNRKTIIETLQLKN
jgi:hypothetical protein